MMTLPSSTEGPIFQSGSDTLLVAEGTVMRLASFVYGHSDRLQQEAEAVLLLRSCIGLMPYCLHKVRDI